MKSLPFATALLVLQAQAPPNPVPLGSASAYPMTVVQGSTPTLDYRNLTSTATLDLKGTDLAPQAWGTARVRNREGAIQVHARMEKLPVPTTFGPDCLTYVMWGITPEGRVANLGEVIPRKGSATLEIAEPNQAFGLILTAEPHFAVSQPSSMRVLEFTPAPGKVGEVHMATFDLLKRSGTSIAHSSDWPLTRDGKMPLVIHEAHNALDIARASGAPTFASEAFGKAEDRLKQAEFEGASPQDRTRLAREATQMAEEARVAAVQKQDEGRIAQDREETARREAALAQATAENARKEARLASGTGQDLRAQLTDQLSAFLQARSTDRGLVLNLPGGLFQNGKAELEPQAREKLAKIAGILGAHKGLKIEASGFSDSTGTEAFNRSLSEKRAEVTRDFLVSHGVPADSILVRGYGQDQPIASNDTPAGRQENRRVELVVTGEGIPSSEPQPPTEP